MAGITPAYAGTANHHSGQLHRLKDHPRIRGNSRPVRAAETILPGSPPHTREQHNQDVSDSIDSGITPAYAGTATALFQKTGFPEDHPRIRGNSSD